LGLDPERNDAGCEKTGEPNDTTTYSANIVEVLKDRAVDFHEDDFLGDPCGAGEIFLGVCAGLHDQKGFFLDRAESGSFRQELHVVGAGLDGEEEVCAVQEVVESISKEKRG